MSLIVTHFECVSSGVTLLESHYVCYVSQFESCLFLVLRHELGRKLLNQAVPTR